MQRPASGKTADFDRSAKPKNSKKERKIKVLRKRNSGKET